MNQGTTQARTPVITAPIDVWARINGERVYWFRAHRQAVRKVYRLSKAYEAAWERGEACMNEMLSLRLAHSREHFCYHKLAQVCGWERGR